MKESTVRVNGTTYTLVIQDATRYFMADDIEVEPSQVPRHVTRLLTSSLKEVRS
jgi:hypothetical protein